MSTLPGTTLCEAALKLFLLNLDTISSQTIFLLSGGYNRRGHSQLLFWNGRASHCKAQAELKVNGVLSMFLIYCECFSFLEIGVLLC